MQPLRVPPRLRERLGPDESDDLAMLLQTASVGWREDVLTLAEHRFERAVAIETGKLRLEMRDGIAGMREEMARLRVEVLRWSFLFWLGQIAAITGLLAYLR